MIVLFIVLIIILIILFYNFILWLRKRELSRRGAGYVDADEIGAGGAIREGMKDPFKDIGKMFKQIPDGIKKSADATKKNMTKGFDKLGRDTKNTFNKVGGEIKKETTKAFNDTKKATEGAFNEVKKGAENALNETMKGLNSLKDDLMKPLGAITGLLNTVMCYLNGIGDIFVAIGNYMMCGFQKIVALPTCFLYYFLDILYYTFLGLPIWFFTLIFPPLKGVVKMVYDNMMKLDKKAFDATGFHIFKYQESVLNRCYRCKGLNGIPSIKEKCSKKDVKIETKNKCGKTQDTTPPEEDNSEYSSKLNYKNVTGSGGDAAAAAPKTKDVEIPSKYTTVPSVTVDPRNIEAPTSSKSMFSTETVTEKDLEGRDL